MRIAFRAIHEHMEFAARGNCRDFVAKIVLELPPPRLAQFGTAIHSLQQDAVNSDRTINKLSQFLTPENFDMLLAVFPPHLHLRWALRHGRPLPRFSIDFQSIPLPFEFLQAIADIEGEEAADAIVELHADVV
jgi:hypothetical protein